MYSRGFKRRLSAAISLIGDPPVVLFDEPTAGVDVMGKRLLWDVILDTVASGQAVLFTSNNMEECEVLCNRVAILVRGKIFCLDTLQGLKSRFGHGHRMVIKAGRDRDNHMDEIVSYALHRLPGSYIVERNLHMAKIQLPNKQNALPEAVNCAMDIKRQFNVEACSLIQNSLDDVFVEVTQSSVVTN
uniref:ATPase AAA-type core domain-containing protein n=1 Tax=Trichuris muris TaxID=70415 RepID=A0A5S6QM62_TRIMR